MSLLRKLSSRCCIRNSEVKYVNRILRKLNKAIKDPYYRFRVMSAHGLLNGIPDEKYLKIAYKLETGKTLNLENPQTFNEKLQWLKLNDRKPIYTRMVDKYAVKEYVASLIGAQYIIPTLGLWDTFEDISFDELPNQFVLKCTHDSGGLVICKSKSDFNVSLAKKKINASLKRNYYYSGREWPYKDVYPRILAEEYMVDESGYELKDYKLFTFGGKVKCIQVDYDRFTNHRRNFYDCEWNYLPFTTCYPTDSNHIIGKPTKLNEMIDIAEKLAKSVGSPAHLRVDLYYVNGRIYFGELTFYHGSGHEVFYPDEWGYTLGAWIKLPIYRGERESI